MTAALFAISIIGLYAAMALQATMSLAIKTGLINILIQICIRILYSGNPNAADLPEEVATKIVYFIIVVEWGAMIAVPATMAIAAWQAAFGPLI